MIERGYIEMKKEYIKPEAELMKFVETEELMTDPMSIKGEWNGLGYGFGASEHNLN